MTRSAMAVMKDVRVFQDAEPPESATISRKDTTTLGPYRRLRSARAALRQANIRAQNVRRLEKFKSKFLVSAVPTP